MATVTDHKEAHKGDMTLFWDEANHQALCLACNSYKNVKHEGGFGNEIKPRTGELVTFPGR